VLVLNRYGLASSPSWGEPGLYGFGRADRYVSVFQTCLCSPTPPKGWARFRSSHEEECRDLLDLPRHQLTGWRRA